VNDFYVRFINPTATDKQQVSIGRISTVLMMAVSAVFALMLTNALQAFNILLQIGAGTGLIFILRWFWWRINSYTELAGMVVSFLVALWFEVVGPLMGYTMPDGHWRLLIGVGITTAAWLAVTFMTRPETDEVLTRFYTRIGPSSFGWKPVLDRNPHIVEEKGQLPFEIMLMVTGCFTIYSALFATGYWIYGNTIPAFIATFVAVAGSAIIIRNAPKLKFK
jgi:Na+/proline symporter